jgi:cytochrome c-type biogenesis protein CcmH/NrfG
MNESSKTSTPAPNATAAPTAENYEARRHAAFVYSERITMLVIVLILVCMGVFSLKQADAKAKADKAAAKTPAAPQASAHP